MRKPLLTALLLAVVAAFGADFSTKPETRGEARTWVDVTVAKSAEPGIAEVTLAEGSPAIAKELTRDGFVLRYDTTAAGDGLRGTEGAFLACTLWLADDLHLIGREREAREVFEPTLAPRDFDVVEIPFPERGEPELVPNGARSQANGEPETAE